MITDIPPDSLFLFPWRRAESYRIVTDAADLPWSASGVLVEDFKDWQRTGGPQPESLKVIVPVGEERECYPLRETPRLTDALIAMGDSDAAVIKFAKQHGLLEGDGAPTTVGDFLSFRGMVCEVLEGVRAARKMRRSQPKASDQADRRDVARLMLDAEIRYFNEVGGPGFELQIVPYKRHKTILRMVPTSLSAAIRLLVAQEIVGEVEWSTCGWHECKKPFTAGPDGQRQRGSAYCSDACAEKAHNAARDDRLRTRPEPAPGRAKRCPYCRSKFIAKGKRRDHCGAPACRQKHYRKNHHMRETVR